MKLKVRGVEQCFPHSIKVTSKGFSKYLFYGEDRVRNHLSFCPHAAVLEIRGGAVRRGEKFLPKELERQTACLRDDMSASWSYKVTDRGPERPSEAPESPIGSLGG